MERKRYVYWQEEDMWLGYFVTAGDYQTHLTVLIEPIFWVLKCLIFHDPFLKEGRHLKPNMR